ncbi:MAG: phosphodiester glycosidase family protein [Chloroflexi bacterium]|nr:phosphodiester glycosidase family protein [Chloroflexota bacterium]
MKKKMVFWGMSMLLLLTVITGYYWGRPAPVELRQELYPCVVYYRRVHYVPRMMVAHIVTVDLTCKNINVLVTPPEKGDKVNPLRARTTSQFANEFNVQVAINGDGFTPWKGDPIRPNGFAASRAKEYGEVKGPTLFVNSSKNATFGTAYRKVYNAISGQSWLVQDKQPVPDLNDTRTAPRTALGLDGPGTRLIMIVIDGRQPFYSEGATLQEMAELMIYYGGDNAINLDGGGSSTLVIQEPESGQYRVMNSPIQNGIPGQERPVGNHFGIISKDE